MPDSHPQQFNRVIQAGAQKKCILAKLLPGRQRCSQWGGFRASRSVELLPGASGRHRETPERWHMGCQPNNPDLDVQVWTAPSEGTWHLHSRRGREIPSHSDVEGLEGVLTAPAIPCLGKQKPEWINPPGKWLTGQPQGCMFPGAVPASSYQRRSWRWQSWPTKDALFTR